MKKYNYLPRVLCILLVMFMISSIGVGYTYSKYIKNDRADDAARVTTFGVTTGVEAGAFADTYTSDTDGTLTVVDSLDSKDVVAPGTKGEFSGINIQGTPEVSVKVTTTADLELTGWTTDGSDYYCPLRITVGETEYYGMDYQSMDAFEAAVEGAITVKNGEEYAPGTNLANQGLNSDYSWEWVFKGTDGKQTTEKDTALGDRSAAGNPARISLTVTAKVEQID